jgi:hypothetical protein
MGRDTACGRQICQSVSHAYAVNQTYRIKTTRGSPLARTAAARALNVLSLAKSGAKRDMSRRDVLHVHHPQLDVLRRYRPRKERTYRKATTAPIRHPLIAMSHPCHTPNEKPHSVIPASFRATLSAPLVS